MVRGRSRGRVRGVLCHRPRPPDPQSGETTRPRRGRIARRRSTASTGLAADGFRPVLDRDEIRSGERISAFIRRLTRADLVVAVISDKYLRSPYCMYEIYRLWQRFQADGDLLVEHLVPWVLPEVKIMSLEERALYIEHWLQRLAELEDLIRKLGLRVGRESFEDARLVAEFVHHVEPILHFLNDVFMRRELEIPLDDGFEAVRDALHRRVR